MKTYRASGITAPHELDPQRVRAGLLHDAVPRQSAPRICRTARWMYDATVGVACSGPSSSDGCVAVAVAPDQVDLVAGPGREARERGEHVAEHVGAGARGADDHDVAVGARRRSLPSVRARPSSSASSGEAARSAANSRSHTSRARLGHGRQVVRRSTQPEPGTRRRPASIVHGQVHAADALDSTSCGQCAVRLNSHQHGQPLGEVGRGLARVRVRDHPGRQADQPQVRRSAVSAAGRGRRAVRRGTARGRGAPPAQRRRVARAAALAAPSPMNTSSTPVQSGSSGRGRHAMITSSPWNRPTLPVKTMPHARVRAERRCRAPVGVEVGQLEVVEDDDRGRPAPGRDASSASRMSSESTTTAAARRQVDEVETLQRAGRRADRANSPTAADLRMQVHAVVDEPRAAEPGGQRHRRSQAAPAAPSSTSPRRTAARAAPRTATTSGNHTTLNGSPQLGASGRARIADPPHRHVVDRSTRRPPLADVASGLYDGWLVRTSTRWPARSSGRRSPAGGRRTAGCPARSTDGQPGR